MAAGRAVPEYQSRLGRAPSMLAGGLPTTNIAANSPKKIAIVGPDSEQLAVK
jgi:hypothetical protein